MRDMYTEASPFIIKGDTITYKRKFENVELFKNGKGGEVIEEKVKELTKFSETD